MLLFKKVINNLTDQSLQEFESFMKEICPKNKFHVLKNSISIFRDQSKNQEGIIIDIQELVPIRQDEEKWEVCDLLLHKNPQNTSAPAKFNDEIMVDKIKHS